MMSFNKFKEKKFFKELGERTNINNYFYFSKKIFFQIIQINF